MGPVGTGTGPTREEVERTPAAGPLATDLGIGREDYEPVTQPAWQQYPAPPSFGAFGGGFYSTGAGGPYVAHGGGRVYVSSAATDAIHTYNADSPATGLGSFNGQGTPAGPLSDPRGISYYNEEVYVADAGNHRVVVFDRDGGYKRVIGQGACAKVAGTDCPQGLPLLDNPQGLDVAWGRLYVSDSDLVKVFNAKLGVPLGVSHRLPDASSLVSPTGSSGKDVATAPDSDLYLAGRRAHWTMEGLSPIGVPWPNNDIGTATAAVGDWCVCANQRGTDWVWGMEWLLSVDQDGQKIDEFSSTRQRRSWAPAEAASGKVNDVAYRKRDARIDWWDRLASSSEWLRVTQPLQYIVSDADIYVVGDAGEYRLEPAPTFSRLELRINGRLVDESDYTLDSTPRTSAMGTLKVKTDARDANGNLKYPSGDRQTLTFTAYFTDRPPISTTREDLRLDNTLPEGTVATANSSPLRGDQPVAGTISDAHAGPKDWGFQVSRVASRTDTTWGTTQTVCGQSPAPGCVWQTANYSDGWYRLRARLRDQAKDGDTSNDAEDGNEGYSPSPDNVMVDNNAPTITAISGPLKDSAPGPFDGAPTLQVSAADGNGSGIKSIELLVDGISRDSATQSCPDGFCTLSRGFTLHADDYSEGQRTIKVAVADQVGLATDYPSWQVDIRNKPNVAISGELVERNPRIFEAHDRPLLRASAIDSDSGLDRIEFRVDSVPKPEATVVCGGQGQCAGEFTFAPGDYPEGNHTIRAAAVDRKGHESNENEGSVTVTVERNVPGDPAYKDSAELEPPGEGDPGPDLDDGTDDPYEPGPSAPGGGPAYARTECSAEDEWVEQYIPDYLPPPADGIPTGEATPEAALALFLALPMVPPLPLAAFEPEVVTDSLVSYVIRQNSLRQAVADVIRAGDDGWRVAQFALCSTFNIAKALPGGPQ